jgi:hypothetical protein
MQSAEILEFTTGPTEDTAYVTLGGNLKPNGTVIGKDIFTMTGRRLSTEAKKVRSTVRM